MQTQTHTSTPSPVVAARAFDLAAGTRAFGTGYGRSSRYGTPRSYSQSSVPTRFRVV